MDQIGYTSRAENVAQFLTVFLVFILILVLTYFTTKFVGTFQAQRSVGRNFELIETYRITNGKYLQLMKVGSKYVVIAISKDTVSTVCELSEDEVMDFPDDNMQMSDSFKMIFDKAKGCINKGGNKNDK